MNIGNTRESLYISKMGATPSAPNTRGMDGYYRNGESFEFKTFCGSKPSLGGKYVLDGQTDILTAIASHFRADWLVVETAENEYLTMPRAVAIQWLYERVTLTRASMKKGGFAKLRINPNPRTEKASAKILAAGYTL